MILYANGCSHTWGSIVEHDKTYIHIVMESLVGSNYTTIDVDELEQSDDEIIKNLSSLKSNEHYLLNASKSGKGNSAIQIETIKHILMIESFGIKVDYSTIQFSGESRNFIITPGGQFVHTNVHDGLKESLLFEPYGSQNSLINIFVVQEFLKNKNIKFAIIPYHDISSTLISKVFEKNCFDLKYFTCHPNEGHRKYFLKNGLAGDAPGHPDYFGNYYLAEKCLNIFGEGNSLIGFRRFYNQGKFRNFRTQNLENKEFNKKFLERLGDEGDNETLKDIR